MRVIVGGNALARAMAYGGAHQNVIQNVMAMQQDTYSNLSDLGRAHFQQATERAQTLVDYSAVAQARAAMAQIHSYFQADVIRRLTTIEEVQNAPDAMVRWLMTEPEVRTRLFEQRIEGYGERYVDTQPKRVGVDHDDYCRVHSGYIDLDKDEGPLLTCHVVGAPEDDVVIPASQKLDIHFSLDVMRLALLEQRDPTDKLNSDL